MILFCPWVFVPKINYLPWDRKGYESFHSMIDPTAIVLIWIFTQIQKRADMNSRLIGSGLFDCPSSPGRAKVEYWELHDLFSCQVTDCSVTSILSSSITGHHPRPTGSLDVFLFFFTPLQRCSRRILQPQPTGWVNHQIGLSFLKGHQCFKFYSYIRKVTIKNNLMLNKIG